MQAQLVVGGLQRRVELVGAMDPAAIDDQHDLVAGGAESRHHWMDILTQCLRLKVWDDCREDFGGAVLDGAKHTEQHAAGDPAPRAIPQPCWPFETLLAFEL